MEVVTAYSSATQFVENKRILFSIRFAGYNYSPRNADPSATGPRLRHSGRPRPVIVRNAGDHGHHDDGPPSFRRGAQRHPTKRIVDGDVALHRETDHVPDAEEAADVGDVRERLAHAVQCVDVDRCMSGPRQHDARKKTDADDTDGGQVDVGGTPLHGTLAEDEQRH